MSVLPASPGPLSEPELQSRLPALWPPDYDTDSSSVHSPETNATLAEKQTEWGGWITSSDPPVVFRHSGWQRLRTKIRAALEANAAGPRQLQRFDLCGSEPWVAVDPNDPTRFTLLANHCHSRWCTPCARERGRTIAGNLQHRLGDAPVRLLTLTLKHSDTPLRAQLDRLYLSFRKLRAMKFWKAAVEGGAAVLEIKHGWRDQRWHPHLHVLFHGSYLAHQAVKAAWWRITRDSFIVDIRMISGGKHAAAYVSKYVSKPIPNTVLHKPHALSEMLSACHGRRLVLTFGTWRGFKLTEKLDATEWRSLCPLTVLYERLEAGDPDAALVIQAIEQAIPDVRALAGRSPPA